MLVSRAMAGESVPRTTTVRARRDGSLVDVSITVSPIRNSSGEVTGVANIIRDITERKAAQARILELNATLEQQVIERTSALASSQERLEMALEA